MDENSLSVFESKILGKMYGLCKDVIIQGNEVYENRELKELYQNPSIVPNIKSRRHLNGQDKYDVIKGSVPRTVMESAIQGKIPLVKIRDYGRGEHRGKKDVEKEK